MSYLRWLWRSKATTELPCKATTELPCKRDWAQNTTIQWTTDYERNVRENIEKYSADETPLRILLFGGAHTGKSSLANSIISSMSRKQNVDSYFSVGSAGESLSQNIQVKKMDKIEIIDMPGARTMHDKTNENIERIIRGKVPFYKKLDSQTFGVKDEVEECRDQVDDICIGCVVLVARMDKRLPDDIKRMFEHIVKLCGEGVTSYRVILTYVDEIDGKYKSTEGLEDILDSINVQYAVKRFSEDTNIPGTLISVVRNYFNEPQTDMRSNILILHAFEKVVGAAVSQIEKKKTMDKRQ